MRMLGLQEIFHFFCRNKEQRILFSNILHLMSLFAASDGITANIYHDKMDSPAKFSCILFGGMGFFTVFLFRVRFFVQQLEVSH